MSDREAGAGAAEGASYVDTPIMNPAHDNREDEVVEFLIVWNLHQKNEE